MAQSMYIETVPNRNSPPAILLRETWREGGKVKKRTVLNLTNWPTEHIEGLRIILKGGTALPPGEAPFTITRSLPHGHVAAILGTIRATSLDRVLGPEDNRPRNLVLAMIINRIIAPGSKLAMARMLDEATACTSTARALGLGPVAAAELYQALDWLAVRQPDVETKLARKHLKGGCLVLYDVSSSYVEGRCCELAQLGYSRDGKRGKLQIVYGLLCAADGCPVAVGVFEGNTGDPKTLAAQIDKLKQRFKLDRVVLVGDRASARTFSPLGSTGSPPCALRRSRRWQPREARCRCRCSTSATWPKSARLTIPVSGSSSAVTASWPSSGHANAASFWKPPRRTLPASRRPWTASATPCAVRRKSAWRWAR
jgi:hypothetical protein